MSLPVNALPLKLMQRVLLVGVQVFAVASLVMQLLSLFSGGDSTNTETAGLAGMANVIGPFLLLVAALFCLRLMHQSEPLLAAFVSLLASSTVAFLLFTSLESTYVRTFAWWSEVIAAWLLAWACVEQLAGIKTQSSFYRVLLGVLIPALFGIWLLILWEILTRAFDVPQVLLPAPSVIGQRFVTSTSILWAIFNRRFCVLY